MNSGTRHANEGPIGCVDALGKLGAAVGTLFVGGVLFGDFAELVDRAFHGFAATAGVAGGTGAAGARRRSRRFQHDGLDRIELREK